MPYWPNDKHNLLIVDCFFNALSCSIRLGLSGRYVMPCLPPFFHFTNPSDCLFSVALFENIDWFSVIIVFSANKYTVLLFGPCV